jgi:hypothetical protein
MTAYSKSIAAALGALAVWGASAVADGHVTATECVGVVVAMLLTGGLVTAINTTRHEHP